MAALRSCCTRSANASIIDLKSASSSIFNLQALHIPYHEFRSFEEQAEHPYLYRALTPEYIRLVVRRSGAALNKVKRVWNSPWHLLFKYRKMV